ncbi:MAG TPA: hypothetical protein VD793_05995 [Gemmatimonadales bacterium]|nr:hypothetical protein [Gemmatimonadales bacterium]
MTSVQPSCDRCGSGLEILKHPLRRLRGSGYWREGLRSLFALPLRVCPRCGAIYRYEGQLLAVGAAETAEELRLKSYREDMAHLRDSFAAVAVAAEFAVIWMSAGTAVFPLMAPVIAIGVGGSVLLPFAYFARKAREARRELKRLRQLRVKGELPP